MIRTNLQIEYCSQSPSKLAEGGLDIIAAVKSYVASGHTVHLTERCVVAWFCLVGRVQNIAPSTFLRRALVSTVFKVEH